MIAKFNIFAVIAALVLAVMLFVIPIAPSEVKADQTNLPKVTVEQKTVHRGQTFTVKANLTENTGLISLCLSLSYDSTAMRLTGVKRSVALQSLTYTSTNTQTDVSYDIVPFVMLWDGKAPDTSKGELIEFTFESFTTAPVGVYPITLTLDQTNTNSDYGKPVSVEIENGSVTLVKGEFEAVYIDWDGTVLYTKDYNENDVPAYVGATPERQEDEMYSYAFSGWKGVVSDKPNVITYQADYILTPKVYQVFYFVDGYNQESADGAITYADLYKADELEYGAYMDEEYPTKPRYLFSGWFTDVGFTKPFTEVYMPAHELRLYGYFVLDIRTTQIPKIRLNYSEETEDGFIVTAEMVANTGFNGLVLPLEYDESVMRFVGYEKCETFSKLQFDTTNEEGDYEGLFKFYYEHSENTFETGVFLKLKFTKTDRQAVGAYRVTFAVGETDATYVNGSNGIRYTEVEIIGATVPLGKIYEWTRTAEDNADVIIKCEDGMPADTILRVTLVPESVHNIDDATVKSVAGEKMQLISVYKLRLVRIVGGEEIEVEPSGRLTVEIRLTAVQQARQTLALYYVNDENKMEFYESRVEGGVLSFSTDHLSLWALVGDTITIRQGLSDAAVMLITLPILLAIVTMSYALIITGKNKKKEKID